VHPDNHPLSLEPVACNGTIDPVPTPLVVLIIKLVKLAQSLKPLLSISGVTPITSTISSLNITSVSDAAPSNAPTDLVYGLSVSLSNVVEYDSIFSIPSYSLEVE
jgi:hypothetical protein